MASNEIKIILSADAAQLSTEARQASDAIDKIGTSVKRTAAGATKGFSDLKSSISGVPKAFDEVAASAEAMTRISKRIDDMAAAAIGGGQQLQAFATKLPLHDLKKLDLALRDIKRSIEFKDQIGLAQIKFAPTNFTAITNSVNKLKSSSSSAALALNDIGRIAQDVPFGFIGIQNNLNPLLESFRRLKAETGSTGAALKAMASQIGGVGGIGLALSIASSAFLIFQNGIAGFNRSTKTAKDEFKAFLETIRDTKRVTEDAIASTEAEIIKVQTLASAIRDVNRTNEERKNALNDLKQINKEYFSDLTLEAGSLVKLTAATDEYTKALLNQAIAKGFADELSKVSVELYKQERILKDLEKAYAVVNRQVEQQKTAPAAGPGGNPVAGLVVGLNSAKDAVDAQRVVVAGLRDNVGELSESYRNALNEGLKFKSLDTSPTAKDKQAVDFIKRRVEALKELIQAGVDVKKNTLELQGLEIKLLRRDGKKSGLSEEEINKLIFAQFPDFKGGIALSKPTVVTVPLSIQPIFEVISGQDPAGDDLEQGIQRSLDRIVGAATNAAKKAQAKLAAPLEGLAQSINGIIVDAFSSIGDSLGDVLSGKNPLASFLSFISGALEQLGKALIIYAAASAGLIEALKIGPIGWPAALAAGIAAIAAGKLLRNQITKMPKLAQGGLVTGPTVATIGDAGPELIVPYNRVNSFMDGGGLEATTRVSGDDLLLIIKRASDARSRRGGN